MTAIASGGFKGFSPQALAFLHKLSQNNQREWFHAHKGEYEQLVLEPALDFISAMEAPLAKISPRFLCVPKRMGGSLLRIYRDTRFARDKRPYKTNIGIHFRHDAFRDIHGPGLYFHVGLDECFVGGGIWHPEPAALARIRQHLLDQPRPWTAAKRVETRLPGATLLGASLQRVPRGFPPDHPLAQDLKRKDFVLARPFDEGLLYSPDLPEFVTETYQALQPFMKFLCASQGARF